MLKKRLIPVLFIKDGHLVRSERFSEYKVIGNVVNEVRRYNEWDIDELICIDISADVTYNSGRDDHNIERVKSIDDIISLVSKECFMPVTFGGGIRSLAKISNFLKNGADKVVVNSLIFEAPSVIKQAVHKFGSQAIVASLDYKVINGELKFYSNSGTNQLPYSLDQIVAIITEIGCGEIFIHSIDNDGMADGYDLTNIALIADKFSVPVIACGGAQSSFDFEELAEIPSVSAIAAGNMFHFTENAYPRAKKELKRKGLNFR